MHNCTAAGLLVYVLPGQIRQLFNIVLLLSPQIVPEENQEALLRRL